VFLMHIPFRSRRSDPYWDLDGRAARDARRQQRFVGSIVVVLSAVILALIVARLPSVDATALVSGPSRPVVLISLAVDAMACCLIFARDSRRGRALRGYGELPVIRA
jgi:DNA-binding transcriptional LysR family regulator